MILNIFALLNDRFIKFWSSFITKVCSSVQVVEYWQSVGIVFFPTNNSNYNNRLCANVYWACYIRCMMRLARQ